MILLVKRGEEEKVIFETGQRQSEEKSCSDFAKRFFDDFALYDLILHSSSFFDDFILIASYVGPKRVSRSSSRESLGANRVMNAVSYFPSSTLLQLRRKRKSRFAFYNASDSEKIPATQISLAQVRLVSPWQWPWGLLGFNSIN